MDIFFIGKAALDANVLLYGVDMVREGKWHEIPLSSSSFFCSTNMLTGRVCTQVFHEKPFFCGLGLHGCLICLLTLPIDATYPVLGGGIYCCLANYLRCRIVEQYNVEEEQLCCCGGMNYYCDYLLFGINYPVRTY